MHPDRARLDETLRREYPNAKDIRVPRLRFDDILAIVGLDPQDARNVCYVGLLALTAERFRDGEVGVGLHRVMVYGIKVESNATTRCTVSFHSLRSPTTRIELL